MYSPSLDCSFALPKPTWILHTYHSLLFLISVIGINMHTAGQNWTSEEIIPNSSFSWLPHIQPSTLLVLPPKYLCTLFFIITFPTLVQVTITSHTDYSKGPLTSRSSFMLISNPFFTYKAIIYLSCFFLNFLMLSALNPWRVKWSLAQWIWSPLCYPSSKFQP